MDHDDDDDDDENYINQINCPSFTWTDGDNYFGAFETDAVALEKIDMIDLGKLDPVDLGESDTVDLGETNTVDMGESNMLNFGDTNVMDFDSDLKTSVDVCIELGNVGIDVKSVVIGSTTATETFEELDEFIDQFLSCVGEMEKGNSIKSITIGTTTIASEVLKTESVVLASPLNERDVTALSTVHRTANEVDITPVGSMSSLHKCSMFHD